MKIVILHFTAGTFGSLIIFLIFTKLSGVQSFSAPFIVLFIGILCALMAYFISPWVTVAVLVGYTLLSAIELGNNHADAMQKPPDENSNCEKKS